MLFNVSEKSSHRKAKEIFGPQRLVTQAFSNFFGTSISKLVLPAQNLIKDEFYVAESDGLEWNLQRKVAANPLLTMEKHELSCFDGALLETMELVHQDQAQKAKQEQHYVIYLCGNDMCMQDIYDEIYAQCIKTKRNFVTFNYKNVLYSKGAIYSELDLINDVISQVERLRDEGVDINKIRLVGHSIGAAFATLTSYVFLKEGTPLKVFNGRSFSNYGTMTFYQAKNNGSSNLEAMLKKMLLSLSNFEIEVAEYYNLLPDDFKDYITVEPKYLEDGSKSGVPDGVVPPEASLSSALDDKSSRHKVISTNRLMGFGHNDPLKYLQAHDNDCTADEICSQFILK